MPRVSVLLPSYMPSREYALECLAGVEAQTYRDFDVVIVDESDPATTEFLRPLRTGFPLRVIRPEQRLGLAKSLNLGVRSCNGEFIPRHDMDDICLPDRLAKQIAFLDAHPEVSAVGSWAVRIGSNGEKLGIRKYPAGLAAIRRQSGISNPFCHPAMTLRRSFFDTYGFYREDCDTEDYELWLRALKDGAVMLNLPEPLTY